MTNAPTVNTGGEMGQIIDHLVCSSEKRYRLQDGRDALALYTDVVRQRDEAIALCGRREQRIKALELILITATHDFRAAMKHNEEKETEHA